MRTSRSLPPIGPWQAPRLIQASVVWHVVAVGWVWAQPAMWPWVLASVVANHLLITGAGLWPRSRCLGPNVTRLESSAGERGELALTIDDGPDPEVTPAVLDALDTHGIRATFFCIAERAEQHPALVREIMARGHSVQNHSFRHPHCFSLYGYQRLLAEVSRAQRVLTDLAGVPPTCFRPPAGLRNPFLDPVLHGLGLHLVSWTRRGYDTREPDAAKVLKRLVQDLSAGDILLLHDGHAAHVGGQAVILDVLPGLAREAAARDLHWVTLPAALPARCARIAA